MKEGERVSVGAIVCTLDNDVNFQPVENNSVLLNTKEEAEPIIEILQEKKVEASKETVSDNNLFKDEKNQIKLTPAAKAVLEEEGLSIDDLLNGLRRINRKDVESVIVLQKNESIKPKIEISRKEDRLAMSPLRRKLSQRLVTVKNETAMLTTFNEIDMNQLMDLRKTYQQRFVDKYGFKLGFMSFFAKAVSVALSKYPAINSMIDGDEIVSPRYHDIGIAVQTPKGLMVPIVRNAETKSIEAIEREIKVLAEKARDKKLSIQEMSGGTFTITNGGVFGSLMSTPIINPPQSAILGMHSIKDRPIAINGIVAIRPMMYVALSYDHRIIDGKDSVGFLVEVKELIEDPVRLLFDGKRPEEQLLGL